MSILSYGYDPDAHLPSPPKKEISIVMFGESPDKTVINSLGLKLFFGLGVAAGMIVSRRELGKSIGRTKGSQP